MLEADPAIIRNADSIFDFSCIRDLFDYHAFDALFDPAGALDDIRGGSAQPSKGGTPDFQERRGQVGTPSMRSCPEQRFPPASTNRVEAARCY